MSWYSKSHRTCSSGFKSLIMSGACARACALWNHSGGPVIVVLVRRLVRAVKDSGAPIVTGESNPMLDTVDQVLNLMSDHVQTRLPRDV